MVKNKKAISTVIATMLIIVLTMTMIIVIYLIARNILGDAETQAKVKEAFILSDVEIKRAYIQNDDLYIIIKRGSDNIDISDIQIIYGDESIFVKDILGGNVPIQNSEEKYTIINPEEIPQIVKIALKIDVKGRGILSDIKDTRKVEGFSLGYETASNIFRFSAGNRQTDLALRWNKMDKNCLRAFAFNGDAADEMGNADGIATGVPYKYLRYHPSTGGGSSLKFDYNKVADFGGSASMVNIGKAVDIQNLSEATITTWIYVDDINTGEKPYIYNKGSFDFYLTDWNSEENKFRLAGRVAFSGADAVSKSSMNLQKKKWYHVVMIWDGSTKIIRLFVDGIDITETITIGVGNQEDDSSYDAYIATRYGGSSYLDGKLCDFFIYNRTLSNEEIKWLALQNDLIVTPNLGAMGEYNNFPLGQMNWPAYAVEDSERGIWVSEFGTPRVSKLNQIGEVILTIGGTRGIGDYQFYGPWGLALDDNNNLYVCNEGYTNENTRHIKVYDKNGNFLRKWGAHGEGDGELKSNYCLTVSGNYVYVSDAGNHRIQKFKKDGTFIAKWGEVIESPVFSGTGINDMIANTIWLGSGFEDFRIEIDSIGTPDTFKWSDNNGATWEATKVKITGSAQTLQQEVKVTFKATTGHTLGDRWDFERNDYQFYSVQGITTDTNGDIWVLDRGPGGDISWIKKFSPTGQILSKFYTDSPATPAAHGLAYSSDNYLYTGAGDLASDNKIFNKYSTEGTHVLGWGKLGSAKDETYAMWGAYITPRNTLLTTDWFGCKIQEWDLEGNFIRTIWKPLNENGYSIKCKNTHASESKQFYQTHTLTDEEYNISFLAYTDGSVVSPSDIVPFADTVFTNKISEFNYEHQGNGIYLCWGQFTASSDSWNIGVEIKPGKSVYISSLNCHKI